MTQAEKDRVMALDAGSDEIVAGMQGLIKARSGM
jgi:hypothetical protein